MKKVRNKNQAYILYILAIICLLILNFIIIIFFIDDLCRHDFTIFTLAFVFFSYFMTRATINGILYFIPREECYVEEDNLIYRRILFSRFILKEIKILLLEIQDIIDRGYKISSTNGDYLNPLNYIITFFRPYERILIKMKSGEEYKIFVDADPYPYTKFLPYHNDNKFIKDFNDLKELVIEEQNKIFFNQKIENLVEKYNSPLDERYSYILNKILDEEKLFIFEKDNDFIINGDSEAIKNLEIFKNINFEEIDFYIFYVNYLSKKEYENKKVLVGYNGIDGKEVTMLKFKEDINEIRNSRSTFKN